MCPRNLTLSLLNLHLSRLSVMPASTRHLSTSFILSSCSSWFFPWTKTLSMLHSMPSNLWRIWFMFLWNFSELELIPKGRTLNENWPHRLINVVLIPMQAWSAKILSLHQILRRLWNLQIFPELCLLLEVDSSLFRHTYSGCWGPRTPWLCYCFLG